MTLFGAWLSPVECTVRVREVGGSNPPAPTKETQKWVFFISAFPPSRDVAGSESARPDKKIQKDKKIQQWVFFCIGGSPIEGHRRLGIRPPRQKRLRNGSFFVSAVPPSRDIAVAASCSAGIYILLA